MCRLLAYLGQPALLAEVVLWPDRSIVIQSFDARERKGDPSLPQHVGFGNLNGDGFGIGWFGDQDNQDTKPCVFTSVTPAWNNENLNRLATKIRSPLMFAHVRAAYPGMPVSEQNCHPFHFNNYLWMHNGVIGGFCKVRRQLCSMLSDEVFNAVPSLMNSDSAMSFALFLHHLPALEGFLPAKTLLAAMEATVATICRVTSESGVTETSLLNFVVSDGSTMVATRFVSPEGEAPASLYYAEGWSFDTVGSQDPSAPDTPPQELSVKRPGSMSGKLEYSLTQGITGSKLVMIASEPITKSCTDWVKVPPNTALVVTKEKGDFVNVLRSPLTASGKHTLQDELAVCLEAVRDSRLTKGRMWNPHYSSTGEEFDQFKSRGASVGPPGSSTPISPPAVLRGMGPQDVLSTDISYRPDHTLTGHSRSITCLLAYDCRLYSGSADCSVQVWEIKDLKWVGRLNGHFKPVVNLLVSNGNLLSVAGRTVRIWDTATLECIKVVHLGQAQMLQSGECSYRGGSCRTTCMGMGGKVYVGTQDSNMSLFDSTSWMSDDSDRDKVHPCNGESSPTRSITPEAAGAIHSPSVISTGDAAFDSLANGQTKGHLGPINDIVVARGAIYSCGGDAVIRVMDCENLAPIATLRGHRGSVLCLADTGDLLLSGSRDNSIRVWDLDSRNCRRTLQGHKHDVLNIVTLAVSETSATASIALSGGQEGPVPKGSAFSTSTKPFLFASASADGTVRLWCGREWTCLQVFSPAATELARASLSDRRKSQGLLTGLFVGHNPTNCMTCAPEISINSATQMLSRHLQKNKNAPAVERSVNALKGLVLTPSSLAVGNMSGNIYIYSMEKIYSRSVEKCFEASERRNGCKKRNAPDASEDASAENGDAKKSKFMTQSTSDSELVDALRSMIAISSVSADIRNSDECFRAAKFVAHELETLGAEVKMTQALEGKNPVVIGRLGRNPDVPTITFYGHYDVQPALEADWNTNPFEMTSIDGYLYGRGTSDNKGPVLGFLFAVKELMAKCDNAGEQLPVNCAFCIEGEEENGSHGFAQTIEMNKHWFDGTEVIVVSNTLWIGENRPCLTYGMRGLICLDVSVSGLKRDLHSGNDGGVFNEPMVDLVNAIGTMVDGRNNILIPGFSDGIQEHQQDREASRIIEESQEFSTEKYKERLGVPSLKEQRSAGDLLYGRWCTPSLSIVDIRSGDKANAEKEAMAGCYRFGPTRFSVIPHQAVGKISIRYVPKQDPEHLVRSFKNHLHHEFAKLRSANSLEVTVRNVGDWWEADTHGPLFKVAEKAVEREWGQKPLRVREGGTMPMIATLEKILQAPAIMLPFGQSSDNPHLANERIRGVNLTRGKNVVRHFLEEAGSSLRPKK